MFFSESKGLDAQKLGAIQGTLKTARAILPKGGYEKESKKLQDKLNKRKAEVEALEKNGETLRKKSDELAKKKDDSNEWDAGYEELLRQLGGNSEAVAKHTKDSEKAMMEVEGAKSEIDDLDKIKDVLIEAEVFKKEICFYLHSLKGRFIKSKN